MKVERKSFLEALNKAKVVLPSSTEGRTFYLRDGNIYAYRHNMFCVIPFDTGDVECTVPANELIGVVETYSDDEELTIRQSEDILQVRCGRSRTNIRSIQIEDNETIGAMLPVAEPVWKDTDLNLVEGFRMCLLPDKKSSWKGVYANNEIMMATDTRVVTHYTNKNEDRPEFWFDRDVVTALMDILKDGCVWCQGEDPTWLYFKVGKDWYGVRSLSLIQKPFDFIQTMFEEYIKCPEILHVSLSAEEFTPMLNRLSLFSKGQDSEIEIKIEPGKKLSLQAHGNEGSIFEAMEVEVDWKEEMPLEGYVDFNSFITASKHAHDFRILKREQEHNAIMFSHDKWKAVFAYMPIQYTDE